MRVKVSITFIFSIGPRTKPAFFSSKFAILYNTHTKSSSLSSPLLLLLAKNIDAVILLGKRKPLFKKYRKVQIIH